VPLLFCITLLVFVPSSQELALLQGSIAWGNSHAKKIMIIKKPCWKRLRKPLLFKKKLAKCDPKRHIANRRYDKENEQWKQRLTRKTQMQKTKI